jgi:ribosomal protein S27AE
MNAEPGTRNRNQELQNTEPSNPEPLDSDAPVCPRCGESNDLAKVKGCIQCLKCNFKFDCNGW